jgi:hypothetical protein
MYAYRFSCAYLNFGQEILNVKAQDVGEHCRGKGRLESINAIKQPYVPGHSMSSKRPDSSIACMIPGCAGVEARMQPFLSSDPIWANTTAS